MINAKNRWWIRGLFWATFMYLFNVILWPLSQNEPLIAKKLLIGILFWLFLGFVWAFISEKFISASKKPDKV